MDDGDHLIVTVRHRGSGDMAAKITSCPMAVTVNLGEQPSLGILWGQITLVIGDQDVLVTSVNAHFNLANLLGMHD
jgi:hypothetical protein